jgi:hypothetical protein
MASFDADAIARLAWRQGSVLGDSLASEARKHAPQGCKLLDSDWLIVTSHDCDIINPSLEKEPIVEILRGEETELKVPGGQHTLGRNPRLLHLAVEQSSNNQIILACRAHERWNIPRELLVGEAPKAQLGDRNRRMVSEWLAKRYIRAAFPTAFDDRWRLKMKEWISILEHQSEWVQGVYLRLDTIEELTNERPYRCHVIVAVPEKMKRRGEWPARRDILAREVETFWKQFKGIVLDEVEVQGTDDLTLADLDAHQRFDADWISFADDSPTMPSAADMRT